MTYRKVNDSLKNLLQWIHRNGNAGYDPYNIKGLNDAMLHRMQSVSQLGHKLMAKKLKKPS